MPAWHLGGKRIFLIYYNRLVQGERHAGSTANRLTRHAYEASMSFVSQYLPRAYCAAGIQRMGVGDDDSVILPSLLRPFPG